MSHLRADYAYPLDQSLVAAEPLPHRSASRLMVLPPGQDPPQHHHVRDLPRFLRPGDALVVNNTRVVPARLVARKPTGGAVEILVVEPGEGTEARAMMQASKPVRPGARLLLSSGEEVEVLGRRGDGLWEVGFRRQVSEVLEELGAVPLPPYIHRAPTAEDRQRYQTVFARWPGSSAAPTAGLHLDHALLEEVRRSGVHVVEVTLHVGPGTFVPVRAEDIRDHVMHEEWFDVPAASAQVLGQVRARGGRVVAVGTTSCRTLEAAADQGGRVHAGGGTTSIFIHPGYTFRVVDALLTNFHLPESTLLMLVCALAGRERVLAAYQEAQRERYRLFSYGDAMLVERPA
jgi:S-adenosylmethionine:tRNA ribosyltransferase-isomerase